MTLVYACNFLVTMLGGQLKFCYLQPIDCTFYVILAMPKVGAIKYYYLYS